MDSYGMAKYCFYVGVSFTLNPQPGLNGALFCCCDSKNFY